MDHTSSTTTMNPLQAVPKEVPVPLTKSPPLPLQTTTTNQPTITTTTLTSTTILPPNSSSNTTNGFLSSHNNASSTTTTTTTLNNQSSTTIPGIQTNPVIISNTKPPQSVGRFKVKDVTDVNVIRKSPSMDSHLGKSVTYSTIKKSPTHDCISINTSGTSSNTSTPSASPSPSHQSSTKLSPNNTGSATTVNTPTEHSLYTQIRHLNEAHQKQVKILNAIFALVQQTKSTPSVTPLASSISSSPSNKNPSAPSILTIVEELQFQIKHLLDQNEKLKEDNAQLRVEIEQYRNRKTPSLTIPTTTTTTSTSTMTTDPPKRISSTEH